MLAHFIVSDDVERSARFYTEVLGGRVVFSPEPTYVELANSWIIINVGGGPTDDKPAVTLEPPRDPDRVSSFLEHSGEGHPGGVCRVERSGCSIPDAAQAASVRDPLLHPRSRWSPDRSGADDRPQGGLAARSLASTLTPSACSAITLAGPPVTSASSRADDPTAPRKMRLLSAKVRP